MGNLMICPAIGCENTCMQRLEHKWDEDCLHHSHKCTVIQCIPSVLAKPEPVMMRCPEWETCVSKGMNRHCTDHIKSDGCTENCSASESGDTFCIPVQSSHPYRKCIRDGRDCDQVDQDCGECQRERKPDDEFMRVCNLAKDGKCTVVRSSIIAENCPYAVKHFIGDDCDETCPHGGHCVPILPESESWKDIKPLRYYGTKRDSFGFESTRLPDKGMSTECSGEISHIIEFYLEEMKELWLK